LNFEKIPRQFNEPFAGLPFAVPMTPLMLSLMEWGLQTHAYPQPSSPQLSIHLGQSLLYAWLGAINQSTQRYPNPTAVELARVYIAQRFARPITLDDLAEAADVSANHLTRLFKEHLNITPSRYLWQYRTQRGVDLLRHTGLSVSQIAQRVGFTTPFHFSRLVKQTHDLSPRQLREKLWKKP
jgi:AraC family transcriptional regulator of arabinose operon